MRTCANNHASRMVSSRRPSTDNVILSNKVAARSSRFDRNHIQSFSLSASAPYAKHQIIFKWRQSIIYRSKLPLPPRPALNRQHSARRRPLLRELLLVRSSINKTTICEIIDRRNKRALHIPGTDNMYACSTTHYSPAT